MIRETNKSVQSNRKLMWMSLIFTLLIFAAGFPALYFLISAKVEVESRKAINSYSSRLTGSNNNMESIQTTLTALKDQLARNLSSVSSKLETLEQQHTNDQSTLQHNMLSLESKLFDVQDILQHNMSTMETKLLYLQAYIRAEKLTCPVESLSFVDFLLSSASSIFPRSLPNYYRFNYDGNNNCNYGISDGGHDMYDNGNKLQVWRNNEQPVQVIYNWTYSDPLGNFLMICKAWHPFVFSMLVLNRDGESRQYYIREYGDLGADGSGSYRWNTGSLLVGSFNIHYVLYQVYGASDPSIIQIFFTVSSPLLGSTGHSSLHYVDSNKGTGYTNNTVYMSGNAHNVYLNYILTSTYQSSSRSAYVATSTVEAILREIF
uniref:Uncharacterized protein LOC100175507 n=1 Tax=Phallusia mammillata TaxID=59560 RepID=A0A6F9DFK7_9ASCI|nr:uncharacterized protein LOC100175507 [Phallusia mammillata]